MIVITGATGQLGNLVIEELLKHSPASELIAAVRHPEKAENLKKKGVTIREADYDRPDTLATAFSGAKKILLISSSEVGKRVAQHGNVIEAAKKSGATFFAYTSILKADTTPIPLGDEHRKTEALIKTSGIPYALLRNGWYTENYTSGIKAAIDSGFIYGCSGDGRISSAPRKDYAAAAAAVLLQEIPEKNVFELAGDGSFTLKEFAEEVSRQSGKPVQYEDMPEANYADFLKKTGIPEALATMLAKSQTGTSKGGLFDDGNALKKLIGRPTEPFSETVQKALKEL